MRLGKKVAIVTGRGIGIGEAIAKIFAREGARIAITGRRKDELERVIKEIERKGGQALALPGSVSLTSSRFGRTRKLPCRNQQLPSKEE